MTAAKKSSKKAAKRPSKKGASKSGPGRQHKKTDDTLTGQLPFDGDAATAEVFYPADTIAGMLDITSRHLRRLASDGVVPKATRGRYPLVGCVNGYVKHLQKVQAAAEHRSKEHTRLNSARADKYELELHEKRGDLYNRQAVDSALFEVCTILNAMLDGSASRIASQLGGGPILRGKLVDEFRNIRKQFATGLRRYSERVAKGSLDNRAAAKPAARRVVKKKGTAKRKR